MKNDILKSAKYYKDKIKEQEEAKIENFIIKNESIFKQINDIINDLSCKGINSFDNYILVCNKYEMTMYQKVFKLLGYECSFSYDLTEVENIPCTLKLSW